MIDNYIKFIHQVLDENIPAKYRLEKDIIKGNLKAIDTKFNQLLHPVETTSSLDNFKQEKK